MHKQKTNKPKLIRITTVPSSLTNLLKGQLRYMSDNFEVIAISSPGKDLFVVEKEEGVPVISLKMVRKIAPLRDLKACYKLYKIFKREKPDIVHTHTPKAGTLGMLAAWFAGVPYRVHTVAGLPLIIKTGFVKKILLIVEQLTYNCATHIRPNSKVLTDYIISKGLASERKLKVIGNGSSNGVDTDFFGPSAVSATKKKELQKKLGLQDDSFVFLYVGRVVKDKGIHDLILTFVELNKKYKNSKLLLVGEQEPDLDPIDPSIEREIVLNEAIKSVGFIDDVRTYFAVSQVLVLPSYREGFPNVVMQAGAMEVAAIVSDINGCNEIIQEGVNGYLFPPKNTEKLYEVMEQALLHKEDLTNLGKESRLLMQADYEGSYVRAKILDDYLDIITPTSN